MLTSIFFLSFFLLSTTATAATPPYTPTDSFFLNCGSDGTSPYDGRNWEGDAHSKFSPSNITTTSSPSTAAEQQSSVDQVPYMTSRIFNSTFTYAFPVSPGPKFLRLYFFPATYSNLNKTQFFFSATANGHSLLTNFSAYLNIPSMKPEKFFLVKEYIVDVKPTTQFLNVTFSPSPNCYAFINGIEIVSLPEKFYIRGDHINLPLVGQNSFYAINDLTALETLYRLNVGGNTLSVAGDTGMFRLWEDDKGYIVGAAVGLTPNREIPINFTAETPNYTAPVQVYTSSRTMDRNSSINLKFNLSWSFRVDSGFYYLLRLHFCEIQLEVTRENERVFRIFINNQTAEEEADVIHWTQGTGIPTFRDYVVWVRDPDGRRSKQDLWLAMHPNMDSQPMYANALLNGLEIFKLNGSDGSLAGPNPELEPTPPGTVAVSYDRRTKKANNTHALAAIIAGVAGGMMVLGSIAFVLFRRRRRVKHYGTSEAKSSDGASTCPSSSLPSDRCRRFSLVEVKSATDDFNEYFVIGNGGFGKVYKGCMDIKGTTTVAIKRLNQSSNQGFQEFQTEIGLLSNLRHVHLVSLIGYCDDEGEMILVYEYMMHGTVREHLYKSNNPPLSWKRRIQICIGAAQGLHYLHTGSKRSIIHRDVKSTNILLDEKWVAKVSDFGLSKLGPKDMAQQDHVSTVVKGSHGYVDPEYYRRQQLTEKSDVYSFGVVLLEVLCARPVIIPGLPKEQVSLAEWGKHCFRDGTLGQMIDPNLKGKIAPECLRKFGEVADSCLREQGTERPGMNDVVWSLEFALQLQEDAEMGQSPDIFGTELRNQELPFLMHGEPTTTDDDDVFSGSTEERSRFRSSGISSITNSSDGRLKSGSVFSEIMIPSAR